MSWLLLCGAILSEVAATLALRGLTGATGTARLRWAAAIATGYVTAFALLSLVLGQGISLGVAYGIWAASGIALTAVLGRVLFSEPLTRVMGAGLGLIAAGVLIVEIGAH